jgi:hypothetical protein
MPAVPARTPADDRHEPNGFPFRHALGGRWRGDAAADVRMELKFGCSAGTENAWAFARRSHQLDVLLSYNDMVSFFNTLRGPVTGPRTGEDRWPDERGRRSC